MSVTCTHLDQIRDVRPNTGGCEECLKSGDSWVHLRPTIGFALDEGTVPLTMQGDGSYEWSLLERDVTALEAEVVAARQKLQAAVAEERDDVRGEVGAHLRAAQSEAREVRVELNPPPRSHGREP